MLVSLVEHIQDGSFLGVGSGRCPLYTAIIRGMAMLKWF